MALSLNTNHPLYPNIIFCIGVDDGQLVNLANTETVFTPHTSASFGSGAYGEHFQSSRSGNFTPYGTAISPGLGDSTMSNPQSSCFAAFNSVTAVGGNGGISRFATNRTALSISSTNKVRVNTLALSTTSVVNIGSFTAGYNRNSESGVQTFVNGVKENESAERSSFNSTDETTYIMGHPGSGTVVGQLVWYVKFNRQLTDQEMLDLHNSLGANNQFALVEYGEPVATPISFTGTIANQTFTAGDVIDVDLATGNYSGTETPFTYANVGTALTGTGLSITSAGRLQGTATEATVSGVVMRGTDAGSNTDESNAFNVTVNAVAQVPQGTVTIGTITKTDTTASVPYTYDAADQTGFEYRLNGGAVVTASASPISLTGLTESTSYTIEVRAINATGAGTWSAVGNFTTDATPIVTATFTSEPLKDNTGSLLTSAALDYVALYDNTTGDLVLRVTGISTNASGIFSVTDEALTADVTYKVDWKVIGQAMGRMPSKAAV